MMDRPARGDIRISSYAGDDMRRIREMGYVLAAVVLAGCGSDQATSPAEQGPTTVSGVFVLQSVNQKALPYSFAAPPPDEDVVLAITSDRITLQLDGTFTEVLIMTATVGGATIGPATLSKNGTFSYTPSTRAISLLASGGARITGTVLNDTMTLNDDGDVFVFKRQP
ncbi:MAG TPA: hypothetical protein VFS59_00880 [Gemmatimonadaceae bacterium]|nr:hypothetical protein [Gemmatimonadaceae bacterium]